MDKVEETEREGGARSMPGGREPPSAEQLDTRGDVGAIRFAFAVGHVDSLDTSNVEYRKRDGGGGHGASAFVVVTEMENAAELFW